MKVVAYVVPGKPVGQNRPGGRGKGGRKRGRVPHGVKTPEQRLFAHQLAVHGLAARRRAGWETTRSPVEVWISVVLDSERPDTDAPVKAILDSLEVSRPHLRRPGAGFLANDRQVRDYHVHRDVDPKRPRIEIRVEERAR